MGRLTAELVLRGVAFVNCLKEVELDLRGHKIPEIENLGATEVRLTSEQPQSIYIGIMKYNVNAVC